MNRHGRVGVLTATLVGVFLLIASVAIAADVRNAKVLQDGSGVRFEYDLEGEGKVSEVTLSVTVDGSTRITKDLHVEGDVGEVSPGKGKRIRWNVLQDFPRGLSGDFDWELKSTGCGDQRSVFENLPPWDYAVRLELKGNKEKLSYSIGMDIGGNLKRQSVEVNPDLIAMGFRDSYTGGKTLLTEEEVMQIVQNFQKQQKSKQAKTLTDATELKVDKKELSYSIGMDIGMNLKRQSVEVDVAALARGFKDHYTNGKTLLTVEEARQTIQNCQKQMTSKQVDILKTLAERNKEEGKKFLTENKLKEGVKTTASGLQYKVIREGTGKTPTADSTVTVHYKGTLINGTEFDGSYKRGQPATFRVSSVIPGWVEALQRMKEGSKWQLYIPSSLAYGDRGAGREIEPNATLIFEVELISVR